MDVLIVMHVESEGPGLFGRFLAEEGARTRTVRLHLGEDLPDPRAQEAVIVLGGPMNVYEEDAHPFLGPETAFLREARDLGLPVLGICLGAQLIAKAAGAPVTKNAVEEVGWGTVEVTGEGAADPLFRSLPAELTVFQWHGDTFAVPEGGALLATGEACRNQAFRVGRSWGLQFHLEAEREMIARWFAGSPELPGMLRRQELVGERLAAHARSLLAGFLESARGLPRHGNPQR
jgi:GMP synthase-like glutamine amidotransferase